MNKNFKAIEKLNKEISEWYSGFNMMMRYQGRCINSPSKDLSEIEKYKILLESTFTEYSEYQLKDVIYSSKFRYCKLTYRTFIDTVESISKLNDMKWNLQTNLEIENGRIKI